jgi:hypothetical protein
VSRRGGDTTHLGPAEAHRKRYTIRFFEKKASDLKVRLDEAGGAHPPEYANAAPGRGRCASLLRVSDKSVDLVITSPPSPACTTTSSTTGRACAGSASTRGARVWEIGARRHARRRSFSLRSGVSRAKWVRRSPKSRACSSRTVAPSSSAPTPFLDSRAVRSDALFADLAPSSGSRPVRLRVAGAASLSRTDAG